METYAITVKPRRGGCTLTIEVKINDLTKTLRQLDSNLNLVVVGYKKVS